MVLDQQKIAKQVQGPTTARRLSIDAIARAIESVREYGVDLDIRVVHFGQVEPGYHELESASSPDRNDSINGDKREL